RRGCGPAAPTTPKRPPMQPPQPPAPRSSQCASRNTPRRFLGVALVIQTDRFRVSLTSADATICSKTMCGKPAFRIYRSALPSPFYIQFRRWRVGIRHSANGLAGTYSFARARTHGAEPREHKSVTPVQVDDQDIAVASKQSGVGNFTGSGRNYLG